MADDIYDRPKGPFAKIQNVLVGILVGMLVLAFALWGVTDVFSPNNTNAVVKVGDAEVGRTEFMDKFNDEMRDYAQENGEGLTPQQAYDRGIPQQLISDFTQKLAIEADASDLGIGVNNRDVARYAENIDAFRNDITQSFDRQQLRSVLAANRMTERDFENDVINALRQQQTLPAIMGGIRAPSDYAQRYNTFVNEIRRARLIRFDTTALESLPEPTETDLKSYIAANQSRFTAPEYRRFLMIRIEPFDFRQDVEITDEQLRERFDTLVGAGELGAVETRDVSVVSVATEEQANNVAARLTAGEDIVALIAELGLPSADEFDGVKVDGLINPDSSVAAFDTAEGAASVAPTGFGTFEVIFIRTINAADVPDFESMREELTTDVIEGQALRTINDYERVIDDRLLEGATIEEIAEDLNVPLSSYPYIDRNGMTEDGISMDGFTIIPGIASDDKLLQAVFTADIGFESDIIASSNGGLAILRVTDTIDSAPKPFETVREQASQLWKAEQLSDAMTQRGVALARRVRDGESLETLAAELNVEIEDIALQRAAPPQDVSPAVLVNLLDGDVGDVARGVGRMPGSYEIAVLDTISNASERLGGQMLDIIRGQVSEQIALDISRSYQDAILNDKPQMVFDDQVRAALNLDPVN
jgi:peptidyl-prolyl cis-trans isomerase D